MKRTILILALFLLAVGAYASTPIYYLDNFQVTNNGKVVLFDDFDSGKLDGWSSPQAANVTCQKPNEPPCVLFLAGRVNHELVFAKVGLVELDTMIYIPPPDDYVHASSMSIVIFCGSGGDSVRLIVNRSAGDKVFKIGLGTYQKDESFAEKAALQPGVWANLTLRMDPKTNLVTAFLDGKPQTTMIYDPYNWRSTRSIMLTGWPIQTKKN